MGVEKLMRLVAAAFVLALLAATPGFAAEKLRIATTGDYPPFNHVDDDGEITDFDVDIAFALCAELGAECEIVLEEWERLIPELRAGTFDVIAASMSITGKRRQLVSFTDRYYSNVVRFVAREGSGFEFAGEGHRLDEGIGIAVRHEDASLLSRLNGALATILANGTYERINARYFPFSIY